MSLGSSIPLDTITTYPDSHYKRHLLEAERVSFLARVQWAIEVLSHHGLGTAGGTLRIIYPLLSIDAGFEHVCGTQIYVLRLKLGRMILSLRLALQTDDAVVSLTY